LVRDDQNDQYIIAVVQDITNRKRNEEELTVYRERLEELVIGRTEALRKSTELVRRSERLASIGTLAAGIAHEVNNPLNAILLTAECMLRINRANDDPELKNALRTISQEAQRGGRIVQSVLQFTREEKSARSSCDLNAIAQNAVELTRSYVRIPAALSVTFELTNPLSAVLANATELEQVVVNLVKNAAEAAEGDVHVLIQTREAVNSGVELVVKDDGPGIPEDEQSRIFDPFFSRRRNSGGVGLGLSLCHRIIDDHGGAISVAGKPGEGTKFTIWLPKGDSTPVDSGDGI